MLSLTFEALLHLFQVEKRYQEIIKHRLSDFRRTGDDMHLHAVADHLDQAAETLDQKQAEAEMQTALRILEQAADQYRKAPLEVLAQTMREVSPDHTSAYYKQRGYYLASLSFTLMSMLSKHLGDKEQSKRAADRAIWMFQTYVSAGTRDNFYLPSSRSPSTTGKRQASAQMQVNKERNALHKVLKKWLDVPSVKYLIWLYNR